MALSRLASRGNINILRRTIRDVPRRLFHGLRNAAPAARTSLVRQLYPLVRQLYPLVRQLYPLVRQLYCRTEKGAAVQLPPQQKRHPSRIAFSGKAQDAHGYGAPCSFSQAFAPSRLPNNVIASSLSRP